MAEIYVPNDKDRELIKLLVACGVKRKKIAITMQMAERTIYKYYRHELETADITANAAVAQMLYSKAMSGNIVACIFWLKTRARWKETAQDINLTSDFGSSLRKALNLPTASDGEEIEQPDKGSKVVAIR